MNTKTKTMNEKSMKINNQSSGPHAIELKSRSERVKSGKEKTVFSVKEVQPERESLKETLTETKTATTKRRGFNAREWGVDDQGGLWRECELRLKEMEQYRMGALHMRFKNPGVTIYDQKSQWMGSWYQYLQGWKRMLDRLEKQEREGSSSEQQEAKDVRWALKEYWNEWLVEGLMAVSSNQWSQWVATCSPQEWKEHRWVDLGIENIQKEWKTCKDREALGRHGHSVMSWSIMGLCAQYWDHPLEWRGSFPGKGSSRAQKWSMMEEKRWPLEAWKSGGTSQVERRWMSWGGLEAAESQKSLEILNWDEGAKVQNKRYQDRRKWFEGKTALWWNGDDSHPVEVIGGYTCEERIVSTEGHLTVIERGLGIRCHPAMQCRFGALETLSTKEWIDQMRATGNSNWVKDPRQWYVLAHSRLDQYTYLGAKHIALLALWKEWGARREDIEKAMNPSESELADWMRKEGLNDKQGQELIAWERKRKNTSKRAAPTSLIQWEEEGVEQMIHDRFDVVIDDPDGLYEGEMQEEWEIHKELLQSLMNWREGSGKPAKEWRGITMGWENLKERIEEEESENGETGLRQWMTILKPRVYESLWQLRELNEKNPQDPDYHHEGRRIDRELTAWVEDVELQALDSRWMENLMDDQNDEYGRGVAQAEIEETMEAYKAFKKTVSQWKEALALQYGWASPNENEVKGRVKKESVRNTKRL